MMSGNRRSNSNIDNIEMRDNEWLAAQLKTVWQQYFFDVDEENPVKIIFGRRARRQLGSISVDKNNPAQTIIRITGWFSDPEVPAYVVQSVIVHEMCHYAHGFHSGIKQQRDYPHAGGVIRREFAERGLADLYSRQQVWLKQEWPKFVDKHYTAKARIRKKSRYSLSIFG